jgi:hypothetical protein
MKSAFVQSSEFIRGCARRNDLVFIISKNKSLIDQDIAHSSLIAIFQGQWTGAINTDWDSSAIATAQFPIQRTIIIGQDGDVAVYLGNKESKNEKLLPQPVMIRNANTIESYVFACGMKRQVYQRIDENKWIDISAPFPVLDEKVGFEAIDGFSLNEIYSVGWNGEIWGYDGKKWTNNQSPTNRILTSVCCAPNGKAYICGQQGIMLEGRKNTWEVVAWDMDVSLDLWDICWFNDKIYVASINNLYTLEGNNLVEVDFGEVEINTCFNLTTSEGVLWSIGKEDVVSFDGKKWQIYNP